MTATLSASDVPATELNQLESLQRSLPEASPLRSTLAKLSDDLRQGSDVFVWGDDELVTTTVAAKVIGVSRPHLYKILDSGALQYTNAGRDRRVRVADLHAYLAKTNAARRADAEFLANRGEGNASLVDLID